MFRAEADSEARPVLVFFYGGAWRAGRKEKYQFVAAPFTRRGYVVVMPDYRLWPNVTFPAFVDDAAAAVNWVARNIQRYGGDPDNIFVAGHSAGAHIAAMLTFDERFLAAVDAPGAICGFIGLAGPYDFLPLKSDSLKATFPEPLRAASQPVNFVDGDEPAALLLHGLRDRRVLPANSLSLADAVSAAGGQAERVDYAKRGHAGVLLAIARPMQFLAPVVDDAIEFMERRACQP